MIEPTIIKCHCGEEVVLYDPLDNVCENCGLVYNLSGQQVLASWDSRVEERYEDDY